MLSCLIFFFIKALVFWNSDIVLRIFIEYYAIRAFRFICHIFIPFLFSFFLQVSLFLTFYTPLMANTNNAEAGPSTTCLKREMSLELAGNVQVYKSSRLEDCLDYSILVNNNISMARDQLANERNWLTWFRLSCTLIILGKTE